MEYKPNRHFIKVDLPAPFSPIKACTVPGLTFKLTSSKAFTPGNALETWFISNTYMTSLASPAFPGCSPFKKPSGSSSNPEGEFLHFKRYLNCL